MSVKNAFVAVAKVPIIRAEPLYRDVASDSGIPWELLAACDWMQCEAKPRHSPVHGEKLGTRNPDGTVYRTKSEALAQCADDLVDLAAAVYGIDLTSAEACRSATWPTPSRRSAGAACSGCTARPRWSSRTPWRA